MDTENQSQNQPQQTTDFSCEIPDGSLQPYQFEGTTHIAVRKDGAWVNLVTQQPLPDDSTFLSLGYTDALPVTPPVVPADVVYIYDDTIMRDASGHNTIEGIMPGAVLVHNVSYSCGDYSFRLVSEGPEGAIHKTSNGWAFVIYSEENLKRYEALAKASQARRAAQDIFEAAFIALDRGAQNMSYVPPELRLTYIRPLVA